MRRGLWLCLCAVVISAAWIVFSAYGQEVTDQRIPAGVAAAHMVGRMVVSAEGAAELIGYYPFLEGIEGPPFNSGDASEKTAHFTFRSSRFRVSVLRNDPIFHLRTVAVESSGIFLRVYYNPNPNQDFGNPDTFSSGQLIWEFQARGGAATVIPFTTTINTGSFSRTSSADFTFRDKTYNLGRLAETVTVELKGAPVDFALGYAASSIPFGGSAIATGWRSASQSPY